MEARQFIRHPVNLPIETSQAPAEAYCLGVGGLAFRTEHEIEPGSFVHIRIPAVTPAFEIEARVVWCRHRANHIELGVEFLSDQDAFRARMVEQVCHIEHYRQKIRELEDRTLSFDEAALEWIGRFSASFPQPSSQRKS
jgi:hypothetical protein